MYNRLSHIIDHVWQAVVPGNKKYGRQFIYLTDHCFYNKNNKYCKPLYENYVIRTPLFHIINNVGQVFVSYNKN